MTFNLSSQKTSLKCSEGSKQHSSFFQDDFYVSCGSHSLRSLLSNGWFFFFFYVLSWLCVYQFFFMAGISDRMTLKCYSVLVFLILATPYVASNSMLESEPKWLMESKEQTEKGFI